MIPDMSTWYDYVKKVWCWCVWICVVCGTVAQGADIFFPWKSGDMWKMSPSDLKEFTKGADMYPVGNHLVVYVPSHETLNLTMGMGISAKYVFFYWKPQDGAEVPTAEDWRGMWITDESSFADKTKEMRLERVTINLYDENSEERYDEQDVKEVEKQLATYKSFIKKEGEMKKEKKKKEKWPNGRIVESWTYTGENKHARVDCAKVGAHVEYIRCHFAARANAFQYDCRELKKEIKPKDLLARARRMEDGLVKLEEVPDIVPFISTSQAVFACLFSYYGIDNLESLSLISFFSSNYSSDRNDWFRLGHVTRAKVEEMWRKGSSSGDKKKDETMSEAPKTKVRAWWSVISRAIDAGNPVHVKGELRGTDRELAGIPNLVRWHDGIISNFLITGYNEEKATLVVMLPGDHMERTVPADMVYRVSDILNVISVQGKLRAYMRSKSSGGASMFSM